MDSYLLYKIFVELACMEGKRNVDGSWNVDDPSEIRRLLRKAHRTLELAANPPGQQNQ